MYQTDMGWLSNFAFGYAGYQAAKQGDTQFELLTDEQHIVSAGEFKAQEFYIQNDYCLLEINCQIVKGQDMYVAVMEKGEFEWEVENESNEFDPETVHESVISEKKENILIDLDEGDYILYFSPVSDSNGPSRLKGDAEITDQSSLVSLLKFMFAIFGVFTAFISLFFLDSLLALAIGISIIYGLYKLGYRQAIGK